MERRLRRGRPGPRPAAWTPAGRRAAWLHAEEDRSEYVEHRGVKETEAESVASVVAGLLAIDTSRYSIRYVAEWSEGDADTIKATAGRVLHAAHVLADAITDTDDQADAA